MKKIIVFFALVVLTGCPLENKTERDPVSDTGVHKAHAKIAIGSDGLTVEQRNVRDRLQMDNKIGSIKHLYIISAYSGDVILYSTVKGKPTSSGKRLTPKTVAAGYASSGQYNSLSGFGPKVEIGGNTYRTNEIIQDDGTYGNSIPYLFWVDARGVYHQHYVSGGQIVHVSDQPIRVSNVIINLEVDNLDKTETAGGLAESEK
jgi:hypothetical protein